MSSYHGRIMNLQIDPENVLDGWTAGELLAYKYGHRDARHNAAVLGNDADIKLRAADARVAELEAAARRVAWFLRETDPHWVRVDTDGGPEIATLLGLAVMLEAALTATSDAGAATGSAPRSEFNTLGEYLDAQEGGTP